MRMSDWSSDVCSSDLLVVGPGRKRRHGRREDRGDQCRIGCPAFERSAASNRDGDGDEQNGIIDRHGPHLWQSTFLADQPACANAGASAPWRSLLPSSTLFALAGLTDRKSVV